MYWVDLTPQNNKKNEMTGKERPCVIFENDLILNANGNTVCYAIPITTKVTGNTILGVQLSKLVTGLPQDSEIVLTQMRVISKDRLRDFIISLPKEKQNELDKKMKFMLDI
ncbi:type II toxin-antitoxin system PemK/MazF family toxin [Flammeovirga yaeyamensis]|nr:type II toxin-antitoxin system PemK/MazF family toxin [Flammeovirga yaeyamensis]